MIEVEVRAKVDEFKDIKDKLKTIEAKNQQTIKQIDKIFWHPKFLDSNKMIIEGGIVPRIRSVGDKCALEFKEILRESGGIELRSELGNIKQGIELLNKLGFEESFTIEKNRQSFRYKNFTIDLDDVNKLGKFIEIEKIVKSVDEKDKARKECVELLNFLSPDNKIENKKYGDMMQELINNNKV
ncbi:MAG: class IV adenylate cyclase [Nanobdellota archaeon]